MSPPSLLRPNLNDSGSRMGLLAVTPKDSSRPRLLSAKAVTKSLEPVHLARHGLLYIILALPVLAILANSGSVASCSSFVACKL